MNNTEHESSAAYQHSEKLPVSVVVAEMEKDPNFVSKALQILSVEDVGSTHSPATAVSSLINHWMVNRDLACYIRNERVDVTALTVLPVEGGLEALENWMAIDKEELAALLEKRGLLPPAFLRQKLDVEVNEPVADKSEAVRGIDKRDVMAAFNGLKWDFDHWGKNLASPSNKLKACRVALGSKKASALWNPADIAVYLLDEGVSLKKLDTVFVGLSNWAGEWREKTALERD